MIADILAVYGALSLVATLAVGVLVWRHYRAGAPAPDAEALLSATAEPERDHAARAVPLADADVSWLLMRGAMLDHEIHRGATRLVLLGEQRDRITAELCLRGQVADVAADLENYLSEETRTDG